MFACVASPDNLVVIVVVVFNVVDRGDDGDWIIGFTERCGYGRGSLDSFSLGIKFCPCFWQSSFVDRVSLLFFYRI